MSTRSFVVCALAGVLVAGCGHKRIAAPAEQKVALGSKTATFRDWDHLDVCAVDLRTVAGDVKSLNAALQDFLGQTSAGTEGVWADEHIDLLEQGLKQLPPALDAQGKALRGLRACSLDEKLIDAGDLNVGDELLRQAKKRVDEGPELLAWAKAKRDIARFKDALPSQVMSNRQNWCPPKPKPGVMPDIFFSFEDDHGKTEWLFCDGMKVVAVPGSKPEFVVDPTSKRKPNGKPYLDAAAKYPSEQVQRSPKLPEKRAKPDASPEPKDEPG